MNVLLAASTGLLSIAAPSFAGSMIIVGNGPELPIIEGWLGRLRGATSGVSWRSSGTRIRTRFAW